MPISEAKVNAALLQVWIDEFAIEGQCVLCDDGYIYNNYYGSRYCICPNGRQLKTQEKNDAN